MLAHTITQYVQLINTRRKSHSIKNKQSPAVPKQMSQNIGQTYEYRKENDYLLMFNCQLTARNNTQDLTRTRTFCRFSHITEQQQTDNNEQTQTK